jgi:endonuclease G
MNTLKQLLFALALLVSANAFAQQQTDTVVNMGNYKSYFSYTVKNPLYITYTLSKGGGDCDRSHFHFAACGIHTATATDYAHSGYDEGHLANAEDFAYNCTLDQNTFCFFNCLPQTARLNRGIWKVWETKLRNLSQTQPLFIIAGGIYSNKHIKPGSAVIVPDYCYKIVINPRTRAVMYCLLFPNDNSSQVQPIELATLKQRLGYALVP